MVVGQPYQDLGLLVRLADGGGLVAQPIGSGVSPATHRSAKGARLRTSNGRPVVARQVTTFVNANSHQEREDILHELSAFTRLSVPDEFRSEVFEKTYISPDMLSGFRVRQPIQAAQDRAIREGSE